MAFPGSELGETWGGTGFGGGGNQSLILDLLSLSCISKEDVELAGGDTSAVFSLRKRSRQETGKQESSALEDIWGLQVGYYPGSE